MFKTREDSVRRTDEIISKLISLWPIWLTLAGGIVTAINFWNTVHTLADDQKAWKMTLDQRQDRNREEKEELRTRLTRLEIDMGWIKTAIRK